MLTAEQAADSLLPLGGPYDPEAIVETARTVAELVRRLNHATGSTASFTYPSEIDRVVNCIRSTMWGHEQLLNQLARCLEYQASNLPLYSDDRADAIDAAKRAAVWLRTAAGARAVLTDSLDSACVLLGRLGVND
jgi:hypothetical protein